MGDTIFGFIGKDFVLISADSYSNMSIIKMSEETDKLIELSNSDVMAIAGDISDGVQFSDYIKGNLELYKYRNGYKLGVTGVSSFVQHEIASNLRRSPIQVNLLLGGFDKDPKLYWIDYLGSKCEIKKGSQGYGGKFICGLLDSKFKENLSRVEAIELAGLCIQEVKKRFILNQTKFITKIISKDQVELISI